MNNDEILKNIRLLSNDLQPEQDISELLAKHKCDYLIKKYKKSIITETFNKICVNERYQACKATFETFEQSRIPYAIIKGVVLSKMAYSDIFCRQSGDIDILLCRENIDSVKQIMLNEGFIQGRITDNGIVPFSRKELLFQISMSHQTAPFVKQTTNPVCPYVNVDINLDVFWGESKQKADMNDVLIYTELTEINNIKIRKLIPEMEFISLCLHHYKDANSIYLLWQRGLNLSLFCDIFFYLKYNRLNIQLLKDLCQRLHASDYVYYCIFYAHKIFANDLLFAYMKALETETCRDILNTFGLKEDEKQNWQIGFWERLFSDKLKQYLEIVLNAEDMNKIRMNLELM